MLLASTPAVRADVIELLNGDILTGTITDLNKDGTSIKSPVSASPLQVRASAIKQMTFPSKEKTTKTHAEQITLANGDTIPCQVLSMDKEKVNISTWYAGKFSIPREQVSSLRFGLSQERTVYTGNDAPSKWDVSKGTWRLTDGTYSSKGSGVLARELELPENVRFSFDLAWQDTPNFIFRFCAATNAAQTKQKTYEFLFNSAGMQIRRIVENKQYANLADIDLKPHEVKSRKISIDIRVNRTNGTIMLYIDGHKSATCTDSLATVDGNFIIFNNRASQGSACMLSNIRVTDWNDGSPSRFHAKIADNNTDVLIDSEGEKISGSIVSISAGETNKRTIQLDVKHSTKPLMVPDRRISSLYFAKPENATPFSETTFTAHLSGFGSVQLDQPKLEDGKITAQHPILGQFTLDPTALASIAQSPKKKQPVDKE